MVCLLAMLTMAACGKGIGISGPTTTEAPTPAPSKYVPTRPYWPLDVGTVWHFVREDAPSMTTDIAVVEDENGCKALHFVKNNVATYHAIGSPTNNLWHVDERADGLYANNCKGGFGHDAYPDAQRFNMTTGQLALTTWFMGARPYFLMPWSVKDGDEFHGAQSYWIQQPNGHVDQPSGMWNVTYKLGGDKLTLRFDEDMWGIAEDWTFQRGEGLVMIERWMDQGRTAIRVRLVRAGG